MRRVAVMAALACALVSAVAMAQPQPPVLSVRPEPARDPWWQRATLAPRATAVRGMPIKRIEPAWCAAQDLTRELFGEELLGPAGGSPLDGLAFSLEASFDGSSKLQTAFVGAYRRCDGERGLFVAIIDRPGERPRLRFLVEVPDPGTAFAALALEPDGTLAVWWCAACDNGHRIAFNRETRGFYVAGPATRRY
ncbi:MAG: hypothetical protein Q8L49_05070 [Burkholderiaceae bacterium]|nr:hypothetical protein [Burkholderiaceae bacterium]